MNKVNNDFLADSTRPALGDEGDRFRSAFAAALERYWIGLRKNVVIVLGIVAAVLIAALILTLLATPQYTAKTVIEISREAENVTNVQGIEPDESNKDLEFYQTQYALLQARTVAEHVARAMHVVSNDALFNAFDVDPDAAVGETGGRDAGKSAATERLDLAVSLLESHITVDPLRGSRLVNVSFTSPSPELSAEVANLWVKEFQNATLERRFASTADARTFLEGRLNDLRKRLEDSERKLVSYAANKEIIPLSDSRDAEGKTTNAETLRITNLKTLSDALSDATRERIGAESRVRGNAGASEVSLNNVALNGMRERRAEIAADLARQLAIFEPEYPQVQALQSQLAAVDKSIAQEESRIQSAARLSYSEALSRERQLQSRVNELKAGTLQERRDSIQFAIYQREVDTNRQLYDALLQRYKEIGVAGVGSNNINIVDAAKVPDSPSSPNIPLNLALGLIIGCALAGAFVFVREELDQSVKDPRQVTESLGLPLLATIPWDDEGQILEYLRDPKSQLSEAYLSAATNISFLTPAGAPKSMAVTSTRPNEGKSTSAFALAIAFSRMDRRCLLIDGDLRNPSLHQYFNVKNQRGLMNILSGEPEATASSLCLNTEFKKLDFLPAGPIPPQPTTLLSSGVLRRFVEAMSQAYDIVIIDSAPLLGLADAPLLSKAVEGMLYTVEANGLKLRNIEMGLRRLRAVETQVFGAIVTKLSSRNLAYGYGEAYGYGYEYASKRDG